MLSLSSLKNESLSPVTQFTLLAVIPFVFYRLYAALRQPPLPEKAPVLISENNPIFGSQRFFAARWEFCRDWFQKHSSFSFFVGSNLVVAVSGDAGRVAYFDSKDLNFNAGYFLLTGADGGVNTAGVDFSKHFNNRLIRLLKSEGFTQNLHHLIKDVKVRLGALAKESEGVTDPFDSVYETVFQLTMRTVGCNEIADDPVKLGQALKYNQAIERSGTMASIMFPWLPTPAKFSKLSAGAKMYRLFDKIVAERKKTGKKDTDALQFMIDQGDSTTDIISAVIGALFAGLLNSGINAAWMLSYLASDPGWLAKVREEIISVAAKHSVDPGAPLIDQLSSLPMDVWETGFPIMDLCLRDSIRLQTVGAAMRKNLSDHDIKLGDAIVPKGAYAIYHLADIHHDPTVYRDPEKWDPSRYLPERAEDKKKPYAYLGWGLGRHPCLGMRFAKLENNIIAAFWIAMFDYELVDSKGKPTSHMADDSINGFSAQKPKTPVYLKYRTRV